MHRELIFVIASVEFCTELQKYMACVDVWKIVNDSVKIIENSTN